MVDAFALAFYSVVRYTKDLDIFLEATPQNAKKVLAALREFCFSGTGLKERDFSKPGKTVQLGYEPVRVDLLTRIDGCNFEEVWKTRKPGSYGREKVYFMGREALIKNKTASGRTQDLADLEILRQRERRLR